GGGLNRIISTNDANFTLTDTNLTRSTGGTFALADITQAVLSLGSGNDVINATGFSGQATLNAGLGNNTILGGSGGNFIQGGSGTVHLVGGTGNDIILAVSGLIYDINLGVV